MKRKKVDRSHYLFTNKALVALIIPLIIEQMLAMVVGLADSIMIASVGEAAVSGVSLVDQVMVLLINIFAALATGGAVVAGQYLGMKREEDANKSATQLVWFITIIAIVITAIVYVGKSFILNVVFGEIEPDVYQHAHIYLMIVTASIPFIALYNDNKFSLLSLSPKSRRNSLSLCFLLTLKSSVVLNNISFSYLIIF